MLDRMRACAAVCCVLTLLYFVLLICFLNPYYMALFLLFFSLLACRKFFRLGIHGFTSKKRLASSWWYQLITISLLNTGGRAALMSRDRKYLVERKKYCEDFFEEMLRWKMTRINILLQSLISIFVSWPVKVLFEMAGLAFFLAGDYNPCSLHSPKMPC